MDRRYRSPFPKEVAEDRIESFNYQILPNDIQLYSKYSSTLYEKCIFCNQKCSIDLLPASDRKAGVELSIKKKRVKHAEKFHTVRACLYCMKDVRRYIEGHYIIAGVKNTLLHSERMPTTKHAFLYCEGGERESQCVHCGSTASYSVRNFFPRGINHLIMTGGMLCDQCYLARYNLLKEDNIYNFYTRLKCNLCNDYFPVTADVMKQYKGIQTPKICDACILSKLMVKHPIRAIIYPNCSKCGTQLIIDRTIDIVSDDKKFFCTKCAEEESETVVILKRDSHVLNIFVKKDSLTIVDRNTGSRRILSEKSVLIDFYKILSDYSEYDVTYSKIVNKWK